MELWSPLIYSVVIFGALGIICLLWGLKWSRRIRSYHHVKGVITGIDMRFTFSVDFTAEDGKLYTMQFRRMGRHSLRFRDIGDSVDVIYNPGNPNQSYYKISAVAARRLFLISGWIIIVLGIITYIYVYKLSENLQDINQQMNDLGIIAFI